MDQKRGRRESPPFFCVARMSRRSSFQYANSPDASRPCSDVGGQPRANEDPVGDATASSRGRQRSSVGSGVSARPVSADGMDAALSRGRRDQLCDTGRLPEGASVRGRFDVAPLCRRKNRAGLSARRALVQKWGDAFVWGSRRGAPNQARLQLVPRKRGRTGDAHRESEVHEARADRSRWGRAELRGLGGVAGAKRGMAHVSRRGDVASGSARDPGSHPQFPGRAERAVAAAPVSPWLLVLARDQGRSDGAIRRSTEESAIRSPQELTTGNSSLHY